MNKEEKDLLKSVEKGEWKSIKRKAGLLKDIKQQLRQLLIKIKE